MKLQMIGCSHHDAAVEFRERVSFTAEQVGGVLDAFRERFPQGELVLLSTCNRVELYASGGDDGALDRDAVAAFLADQQHLSADEVVDQMIYRAGPDAVEHLFTVAASLDSMVLGEAQILSQVKQAYELACSSGSAGPLTHAVFQAASRTAKRVQQETSIHRRRVSIPSVAVGEVVPEVFDTLADKRVVLCGAGEMGEETLRYLKQGGASDICILNRSFERAVALSKAFGAGPPWDSLAQQVIDADLLIGTTSASVPILDDAAFSTLHAQRHGRVLLILDLAVPRDFDPAIGDHSSVYLYQIDDLETACERNRRERKKEWPKAKQIIAEETQRFMQAINHRATGPVIQRLRNHAEELKEEELNRLLNKLQGSVAQGDGVAKEVEKSFDRLINKLLHPPLSSIRDDAAAGHRHGLLDAMRRLFDLGDDS